jgi:hypothetical protein
MNDSLSRQNLIRLHVDAAGAVWLGDECDVAIETCRNPKDFFESKFLHRFEPDASFRLIGSAANAELIANLWRFVRSGPPCRVELANPASMPRDASARAIMVLLSHALPETLAPLSQRSFVGYALTAAVGRGDREWAERLLREHPAYGAVTFLPGIDREAVCRVLVDIVDPRWYRHPLRPDRFTRLYSKLKVSDASARAYLREGAWRDRDFAAFRAWHNPDAVGRADLSDPRLFLWRILRESTGASDKALSRATKHFLRFLVAGWASDLQGSGENGYLARPSEAAAFRQHVRGLGRSE